MYCDEIVDLFEHSRHQQCHQKRKKINFLKLKKENDNKIVCSKCTRRKGKSGVSFRILTKFVEKIDWCETKDVNKILLRKSQSNHIFTVGDLKQSNLAVLIDHFCHKLITYLYHAHIDNGSGH